MFFHFADRALVLAFATTGAFLGYRQGVGLSGPESPQRFSGLEEPVALVADSADHGAVLAVGAFGGLYTGRGSLAARGPTPPLRPAFALPGNDDALLLGGRSAPRTWSGGCEATSFAEAAPLDAPVEVGAPFSDGRVFALTKNEVIIYDRHAGITDRWPVVLPLILAAGVIGDHHALLLDEDGVAWDLSLDDHTLRELPIEATPSVATPSEPFRYLSASPGFAWLSGGHRLVRVRLGLDGLRGEPEWSAQIAAALLAGPEPLEVESFFASTILCTGRSVVFVRAIERDLERPRYLARSVLIEPAPEGHRYRASVLPGLADQARFGAYSFQGRATQASNSGLPVFGFGDGMILRPDSLPWFAPNPLFTSIVELGGTTVIADRAGLLTFLRSP